MAKKKSTEKQKNTDPEFLRFKKLVLEHLDELLLEPENKGRFSNYADWADTLYLKIMDFKEARGVYPNIMLAQKSTYDKIDEAAKNEQDSVEWTGDEDEKPEQFDGGLSGFSTQNFRVEFCLDVENELQEDEFLLVYDEAPTFDGEDIETPLYFRKAA